MLYTGDNPILRVVGVEHPRWSGGVFEVAPRAYSALAFRIEGSAAIAAGGKEYTVNASDILYLPQHMGYTARYTDTELIVIHFVTQYDDKAPEVYALASGEEVCKLFLQALAVWEHREPGYPVCAMAQLYAILGEMMKKEAKSRLPSRFLKVISFINANYRDGSIGIGTICADSGISETAFRQLFRKYYHKTPMAYITELRLEYARNLIAGDTPVEQAATESGFNDPKYFARVVKKRYGCTPRAFKNYGK